MGEKEFVLRAFAVKLSWLVPGLSQNLANAVKT